MTSAGNASRDSIRPDIMPERRLHLGPAPKDFDPARDLVVGPWSFLENPAAGIAVGDQQFEDLYQSGADLAVDAERIAQLANAICAERTPSFNQMHGKAYGDEYWRILLLPWILWISQAVWIRYRYVSQLIERYADHPVSVDLPEPDDRWSPANMAALHREVLQVPQFNAWLSGRIVSEIAPANWRLGQHEQQDLATAAQVGNESPFSMLARSVRSLATPRRCRSVYGVGHAAWLISGYLSLLRPKAVSRLTLPAPAMSDVSADFPDAFLNVLDDTLDRTVPAPVSSSFASYDDKVSRRSFRPGKINLIGPTLILNESEKFLLAHAVDHGERIVCTQHGSSGYQKVNINSVEIENRQDGYLSWGWQEQEDYPGHVRALPSPYYLRFRNKARPGGTDLLYVSTGARIYGHRLETGFQPKQAMDYPARIREFFEHLPDRVMSKAAYRPYSGDVGIVDTSAAVRKAFPELKIHAAPLHRDLLRTRLNVVDHYGTTFGIAMVANAPTILIRSPDIWQIARQAEDVFAELQDAGIVHATPLSASRFAAATWDDVTGWWQSERVQQARANFCRQYAITDRYWLSGWLKCLRHI